MLSGRQCLICCLSLAATPMLLPGQGSDSVPAYVARGRVVEATQRALNARTVRMHDSLAAVLRRAAPDLAARLEPPPPIATGYQLLPRIIPSAPTGGPAKLQPLSYGWRWSEELIGREMAALDRLDGMLARAGSASRALLDSMVTDFRAMVERKKLVDADVNYNWLWQAAYARNPAAFPAATATQAPGPVIPPAFLRLEHDRQGWSVMVPVWTDIEDTTFLARVRETVEQAWAARSGDQAFQVKLEIHRVSPRALYCGATPTAGCVAPARGAPIDLQAHVARFPPNVAVLTTGAGSTHVTAGRAIVLGPHELPRRTLAHEFGHLLGFRDEYARTFRDAGADGYIITEIVPDPEDLMGNSKTGMVLPSHFERLIAPRTARP